MNWHPIIFDGESVRSILAGDKTQTRRVMKTQPDPDGLARPIGKPFWHDTSEREYHCPYGVPGESMLWVRETWAHYHTVNHIRRPDGRAFDEISDGLAAYRADGHDSIGDLKDHIASMFGYDLEAIEVRGDRWRSPIHMPRWASRISLRVTDVRVQRVHSISRDDVIAEGVTQEAIEQQEEWFHKDDSPALAYAIRWNAINGKRAPWATNPFVWAVTFERSEV